MEDANHELLESGLNALGVELQPARVALLVRYHDLLMEWNQRLNLTGQKNERDSVIKNLLNALGPWRQIHPKRVTADIGSGGGLPGIPLAIALEMPAMSLVESKGKKAEFLKLAVSEVAPQIRVINEDANAIKAEFQQVVTCAVGALDKLLHMTASMRARDSRLVAWKGRRDRIDLEIAACKPKRRNWEIIPFSVPGLEADAQRHLCIHGTGKYTSS